MCNAHLPHAPCIVTEVHSQPWDLIHISPHCNECRAEHRILPCQGPVVVVERVEGGGDLRTGKMCLEPYGGRIAHITTDYYGEHYSLNGAESTPKRELEAGYDETHEHYGISQVATANKPALTWHKLVVLDICFMRQRRRACFQKC